jgi:hypothetical protein
MLQGAKSCCSKIILVAAGLAFCSWTLLSVLLIFEAQQKYVPLGRWFVRFAVVLQASSEVVKLK